MWKVLSRLPQLILYSNISYNVTCDLRDFFYRSICLLFFFKLALLLLLWVSLKATYENVF